MKKSMLVCIMSLTGIFCSGVPSKSLQGATNIAISGDGGSDLPPGLTAVEYLESTGTQWIETPVSAKETQSSLSVECRLKFSNLSYGEADIAGSGSGQTPTMGRNGDRYFMWAAYSSSWYPLNCDESWHDVTYQFTNPRGRKLVIDGYEYTNNDPNVFTEGTSPRMFIFASAPNRNPLSVRLSYLSIAIDGEVLFDVISVRFTNEQGVSEGAMYDRVSGELFRNQGTGSFIVGPDKR